MNSRNVASPGAAGAGAALPLAAIAQRAAGHARNAIAAASRRAYESDWHDFETWCRLHGLAALPAAPATVGLFLTDRAARLAVASLKRRLAAVSRAHRLAGCRLDLGDPAIRDVFLGIQRDLGTGATSKAALSTRELRAMLAATPPGLLGLRDRAALLVGFAAALRRSELVALDVADLAFASRGVAITIRRSKTDPMGAGALVGVPYGAGRKSCPVRALRRWLAAAGITRGAVFRGVSRHGNVQGRLSDKGVARIVKRYADAAGVDPARVAGHSLRSGFATTAAAGGADLAQIMEQTRHRSAATARRYVQRGALFRNRAVRALRL
jgi:site-specific recombinase XerD